MVILNRTSSGLSPHLMVFSFFREYAFFSVVCLIFVLFSGVREQARTIELFLQPFILILFYFG